MKTESHWPRGMTLLLVLLLVSPVALVRGQSFRGEIIAHHPVTHIPGEGTSVHAGQVVLITAADTPHLVEHIELSVTAPGGTVPTGAFSLVVYSRVDTPGDPSEGFVTIGGAPWRTVPLGGRSAERISVPLRNTLTDHNPQHAVDLAMGGLAFQIVPVLKGMPPDMAGAAFHVAVSPGLSALGALEVRITGAPPVVARAREELTVLLDSTPVRGETPVVRPPGIARLRAAAGPYLDESRNVAVEAGRLAVVELEVREPVSRVRFSLPSVAEVFFDGLRIDTRRVLVRPPGDHIMLIRLGDFTISRHMTLEPHEEYEVGLDMDVHVKRN